MNRVMIRFGGRFSRLFFILEQLQRLPREANLMYSVHQQSGMHRHTPAGHNFSIPNQNNAFSSEKITNLELTHPNVV